MKARLAGQGSASISNLRNEVIMAIPLARCRSDAIPQCNRHLKESYLPEYAPRPSPHGEMASGMAAGVVRAAVLNRLSSAGPDHHQNELNPQNGAIAKVSDSPDITAGLCRQTVACGMQKSRRILCLSLLAARYTLACGNHRPTAEIARAMSRFLGNPLACGESGDWQHRGGG